VGGVVEECEGYEGDGDPGEFAEELRQWAREDASSSDRVPDPRSSAE
jgi:hypothetical protein